ncbi:MAG: mechanosensitive ion channel family protein [Cyanobacteria bacterium P01_F01_bin.153]
MVPRLLVLSFWASVLILIQPAIALGQTLPIFRGQGGTIPPDGVIRYGNIETAWVRSPLDGEKLFQVTAPTVTDRSNLGPKDFPVEIRAQSVEALLKIEVDRFHQNVLDRLAKRFGLWNSDWSTLRSAEVITGTLNNRLVVQVKSSDRSRALTIITVTQTDIDFYSELPEVLSEEWRLTLQEEINKIEQLASPTASRRGIERSFAIAVTMIVALSIFGLLYWLTHRKFCYLRRQHEQAIAQHRSQAESNTDKEDSIEDRDSNPIGGDTIGGNINTPLNDTSQDRANFLKRRLGLPAERSVLLAILHRKTSLEGQINILKFIQWLLIWLAILTLYGSLIALTYTLPIVTSWRSTLLQEPFRILLIWFTVGAALRVNQAIAFTRQQRSRNADEFQSREEQRRLLRLNTVGGALEGLASALIVLTGLVFTFSAFGLSVQSILAWGAVFGLAISFGTQSLIKDVVNGCLILLEDQFAVGDVIVINSLFGLVEEMNLRSTRLRDPEGQLITIPIGTIADVRNLTRLWSRVNFTIEVAYENDPDTVLALLGDVAQEMGNTPEWQGKMIDTPEVLGIDQVSHAGLLIRVWLKTAPLQQWAVGREYRLRVRRAFKAHGIAIGRPQWIAYHANMKGTSDAHGLAEVSQNSGLL